MKKGWFLLFLLVAVAAGLVAAGCSKKEATQAKTPKDTLVIAAEAVPTTLESDFSGSGQENTVVFQNCCDSFFDFAVQTLPDGSRDVDVSKPAICLLCESYTRSADGLKWTITLKRGVKSFYENELTTADVKWSIDRSIAVKGSGLFVIAITSIDRGNPVTVRDKYTFDLNFAGPNPLLPLVIAAPMPFLPILDATEVKKHVTSSDPWAKEWLSTHTAGFGAYHVQSLTPGSEVVWVANPKYHRGTPRLKKVIVKQVPDGATRVALLKRGEVDIATELTPRQREEASRTLGIVIERHQGNEGVIWGLNNNVPPLDNPKVRQAIAYAVPIDDIVKSVFLSDPIVRVAQGYYPDYYLGGPVKEWPYKRDAAKAKQLLQEARVGPFSFKLSFNSARAELLEVATIIKSALKDIGIEAVVDPLAPAKWQEEYFTRKAESVMIRDAPWVAEASYVLGAFLGPQPQGVANWINYGNPTAHALVLRALDVPTLGEDRWRLTRQAHEIMVRDAPWAFYLLTGYHLTRWNNVKGFTWKITSLIMYYDLYKE